MTRAGATIGPALALACAVAAMSACAGKPPPPAPPPPAADRGTGVLARLARDGLEGGIAIAHAYDQIDRDAGVADDELDGELDGELSIEAPELASDNPAPRAPPAPYRNYAPDSELGRVGAVAGRVVWSGPATASAGCDPGLATGAGIPGAIVALAGIRAGRAGEAVEGLARRLDCGWQPATQVVSPIGARLRVISEIAPAFTATGARDGDVGFSLSLAERGREQLVFLDQPGVYELSDERGGRAWIAVAAHPYTTLTDPAGRFRLDEVPAGSYALEIWLPRAEGPALRRRGRVRVAPGRLAELELALP